MTESADSCWFHTYFRMVKPVYASRFEGEMILRRTTFASLALLVLCQPSYGQSPYEQAVLADDPVASFQMDEPDANIGPIDSTGNVATLNGYDPRGGMNWGLPGIPGNPDGTSVEFQNANYSFACNGACGTGSVMLQPTFEDGVLDLGLIDDSTPLTMEAWFRTRSCSRKPT